MRRERAPDTVSGSPSRFLEAPMGSVVTLSDELIYC